MIVQDYLNGFQSEVTPHIKTEAFLDWEVLQEFDDRYFEEKDFWKVPVEGWCMAGLRNASGIFCKWKSIAVIQKKASRHKDAPTILTTMVRDDPYNKEWITSQGLPIVRSYGGNITLRQLHYRLVSLRMPNSFQHYKRVVYSMIDARWNGQADFDEFVDRDREQIGETKYQETTVKEATEKGSELIDYIMTDYEKNRWENQEYYIEVWIEKKALQGVFEKPCKRSKVALCPCKGNPSLTYIHEGKERMETAAREGKKVVILYFGDYDPTGEDIPRSIEENLKRMGLKYFELRRVLLMEHQVQEMGLPIAPVKQSDSRTAKWDGLGQVELDAIEPRELERICEEAIDECFSEEANKELMEAQKEEKKEYVKNLKLYVSEMDVDIDEEDNEED